MDDYRNKKRQKMRARRRRAQRIKMTGMCIATLIVFIFIVFLAISNLSKIKKNVTLEAGSEINIKDFLKKELADIEAAGLYKKERIITTPQRADIKVNAGEEVLNFCANNYLGLSDNKRLIEAAKKAMDTHGYGMSSVRFICGTQDLHKQLEAAISEYFHTEDTILYAACFDANGGLFEPLFTEEDAIGVFRGGYDMGRLYWRLIFCI